MKLENLLDGINYSLLKGSQEVEIQGVSYDSRYTKEGDVFFCINGYKTKGELFVSEAIKKGATAIICDNNIKIQEDVTVIKVDETRKALALVSATFYHNPASKLYIIGVTGTNGKTTSTFMMKKILELEGYKVGLVGTISNHIGNIIIPSERTTPESLELHKLFREMVDRGCTHCVMEVSSHSLALDRVYGIKFDIGIFTNLTRDHLDFHKTFEEYYKAKLKLFKESRISIVNIDNTYGKRLAKEVPNKVVTYGIKENTENTAINVVLGDKYSTFSLKGNEDEGYIVSLPGEFNVYNALAVISAAKELNVSEVSIKKALENVVVTGRCETIGIKYKLPYTIIVDYAHTPDGLENIIETLNGFKNNRVITVFGCGGDRDKIKRPQMGIIATQLSDYVIVTSDNPRTEEPMDIIKDILNGINLDNYEVEVNRIEAIKKAINMAVKGDVVLIAGKGHETYQELKSGKIHFDEREIVDKILKEKEV